MGELNFVETPKFVGCYQIGGPMGLSINLSERPSRWHQFWMRVCLGWVWIND